MIIQLWCCTKSITLLHLKMLSLCKITLFLVAKFAFELWYYRAHWYSQIVPWVRWVLTRFDCCSCINIFYYYMFAQTQSHSRMFSFYIKLSFLFVWNCFLKELWYYAAHRHSHRVPWVLTLFDFYSRIEIFYCYTTFDVVQTQSHFRTWMFALCNIVYSIFFVLQICFRSMVLCSTLALIVPCQLCDIFAPAMLLVVATNLNVVLG